MHDQLRATLGELCCVEIQASGARWKAGRPLSVIDGMPIAFDRASAAEQALRACGAVMLGQPVMRRLVDASACSATAVAACLCPAALSTSVRGSVIRSASHCGNFAFVPTPDACDRAEPHEGTAAGTAGVHAGSIDDLWQVARVIARHCGGGPAPAGLAAPSAAPEAVRPRCLIAIECTSWRAADEATRTAFEALLDQIACTRLTLLRRRDHPAIEAFEQAIAMPANDDRALQMRRQLAQLQHADLASLADAIVMLSAPGPAPLWAGSLVCQPGCQPEHNTPSALLHAPAVSLPLMAVEGMPVGAQLVGQRDEDAGVVSLARWVALEAGTVVV